MNAFLSALERHDIKEESLKRQKLTTLQVNLGNLCNQSCKHCHIEASPEGRKLMKRETVDNILNFLCRYKIKTIDITGGAPELSPDFNYLVTNARKLADEMIVRSNLTVIFEPGKEYLPDFYKENRIRLVCSLPCYTKENVDLQRGSGVFEKSIKALRFLNEKGFSRQDGLILDLVYNPVGAYLPPAQLELELQYKKNLKENYGIEFNRLLTITNAPIKRFKNYLDSKNESQKYLDLLEDSFNPLVLEGLMCRTFLSVGFDGKLYDCDFNQALGLALKDKNNEFITIGRLEPDNLEDSEIILGEHCLSCASGSGSSCQGALNNVKDYYGKVLKSNKDLKTNACCSIDAMPLWQSEVLKRIEPQILNKFYGCGSPIPPLLEGCRVLDLGCGSGRDVYLASYFAGEKGFVTGVDMTDEQLEVARKYRQEQMARFGFKSCNVEFKRGYIEDLKSADIIDNSQDVVISNCVINLSPDKKSVFSEIFRVLTLGGELYFSDVFADRRIPEDIKNDPVLYGECLGGAMYIEDFRRMLRELGCPDYRIVSKRKLTITEKEVREKVEGIDFYSITVRAFKLDDLEDKCEDYGQIAVYLGTIPGSANKFILDDHHIFIAHKPMLICGNTASMLIKTRYARHFRVTGDRAIHYGIFKCETFSDKETGPDFSIPGGCC